MDDQERWYAAACAALEVGPRRLRALKERFGSWRAVWTAGPGAWAETGAAPAAVESWRARYRPDAPQRIREACRRHGVTVLVPGDAAFPVGLEDLKSPPVVLYARGNPALLQGRLVTVVGTRRATPYGRRTAGRIAAAVARAGGVVVSGLAMGIDSCAHQGALEAGGATVAVLAGGVERSIPRCNRALYEEIVDRGLVVSEYPPGTVPERGRFHARNRLMAALAAVTVVVEAPLGSGALITAERALELDRQVMAVPGTIEAETFQGCLSLLREGAACVIDPVDVAVEAGLQAAPGGAGTGGGEARSLTGLESVVYAVLDVDRPVSVETIVRRSGLPPARAVIALTALELRGLCVRQGGSAWRVQAGITAPTSRRV